MHVFLLLLLPLSIPTSCFFCASASALPTLSFLHLFLAIVIAIALVIDVAIIIIRARQSTTQRINPSKVSDSTRLRSHTAAQENAINII
jgi:ABC-type transport system involved in cytochrome bd biosynthesis fused ATPase/permease subunit